MEIEIERPWTFKKLFKDALPLALIFALGVWGITKAVPLAHKVLGMKYEMPYDGTPTSYFLLYIFPVFVFFGFALRLKFRFTNNPYALTPDLYFLVASSNANVFKVEDLRKYWFAVKKSECQIDYYFKSPLTMTERAQSLSRADKYKNMNLVIHLRRKSEESEVWVMTISQDAYNNRTAFGTRSSIANLTARENIEEVIKFLDDTGISKHLVNFEFQNINFAWEVMPSNEFIDTKKYKIKFIDGPISIE